MTDDSAKKAFMQAAEIAKVVPKHLQEIAFNRALDHLLGKDARAPQAGGPPSSRHQREDITHRGDEAEFSRFVDSINRTKHPDVGSTERVGDRALKVLELAQNSYGRDGLSAQQITDILTQKFRLPVKVSAINMALVREPDCVDVRRNAEGVKTFHLMAPGEEYLQQLRSGQIKPMQRKPAHQAGNGKPSAVDDKLVKSGQRRKAGKSTTKKTNSSRPGPKAAIENLAASGYFKSARILNQVQIDLKDNVGHQYSIQELAPALVRTVRDGTLKRERNASGQYEYFEK